MGSVAEGEYRTQRYRDALRNVKIDPTAGIGLLEMWEQVLTGEVTFEEYQTALYDLVELKRIATEQLERLDLQQSDN